MTALRFRSIFACKLLALAVAASSSWACADASYNALTNHAHDDEEGAAETVTRSLEIANANGFRHSSVAGHNVSDASEAQVSVLKRDVSIETYPLKR
ncbi:MAG: hypothetical protein EAZ43_02520 [Betaproteobacteria bacterium]|nr:MAG: hypothetical protein EAZ43_02520 [Betaproteobacteria bacterium]